MTRWLFIILGTCSILIPLIGWGEEGPYVVKKETDYEYRYFTLRLSTGAAETVFKCREDLDCEWLIDMAEALNEAHQRRQGAELRAGPYCGHQDEDGKITDVPCKDMP